jgi:hypothetical protein
MKTACSRRLFSYMRDRGGKPNSVRRAPTRTAAAICLGRWSPIASSGTLWFGGLRRRTRARPCTEVRVWSLHPRLATRLFRGGTLGLSASTSLWAPLSSRRAGVACYRAARHADRNLRARPSSDFPPRRRCGGAAAFPGLDRIIPQESEGASSRGAECPQARAMLGEARAILPTLLSSLVIRACHPQNAVSRSTSRARGP